VDRRLAVHAGPHRQVAVAVAIGLALIAVPAAAAPRKATARAAFDRGVKAYKANDFAAASKALGQSFELEPDPETLFAWAQAERKLDHCETAIDLWTRMSTFDLPAENRNVVKAKIDECKEVLAKAAPAPVPVEVAPQPDDPPEASPPRPPVRDHGRRARWKDPAGLSLLGLGAVGLGVGTTFMLQARSADKAKDRATSYQEFLDQRDRATSKGRVGMIGLVAGGALVVGGVVWFVTHGGHDERPAVSAWIGGDGGGVVVAGGF
jgi:hypothetical protein